MFLNLFPTGRGRPSQRRYGARVQQYLQPVINELIDKFAHCGPAELVAGFTLCFVPLRASQREIQEANTVPASQWCSFVGMAAGSRSRSLTGTWLGSLPVWWASPRLLHNRLVLDPPRR
jgi:hypothetical protein